MIKSYLSKRLTIVQIMKVGQHTIHWRGKTYLVKVERLS